MTRFRDSVIEAAANGDSFPDARMRQLATDSGLKTVILVEGVSDQGALEAIALRRVRDLDAEGACIVPIGGATSIWRFLSLVGPNGLDVRVLGLCDVGEERHFRRALESPGGVHDLASRDLDALAFFVCVDDLEYELIRALGRDAVEGVIEAQGDLKALRVFQNQPAQRTRSIDQQLHRFLGTMGGRKIRYARALAEALAPDRLPEPLERLLSAI